MSSFKLVDQNVPLQLLGQLGTGKDYDVVLFGDSSDDKIVNGIKAHKLILSAASTHLRTTFASVGYRDSNANECKIEAVNHDSLQAIVHYIYTGELSSDDDVLDYLEGIFIGADYLDMPGLVRVCESRMVRLVLKSNDIEDAIRVWLFEKQYIYYDYNRKFMVTKIVDMLMWVGITESEAFLNLSADDMYALTNDLKKCIERYPNHSPKLLANKLCDDAVAWLDQNAVKAGNDFVLKLLSGLPLATWSITRLQKFSEKQYLGMQALGIVRQMLMVRKNEAVLKERCDAQQTEINNLKRKLEEDDSDDAEGSENDGDEENDEDASESEDEYVSETEENDESESDEENDIESDDDRGPRPLNVAPGKRRATMRI